VLLLLLKIEKYFDMNFIAAFRYATLVWVPGFLGIFIYRLPKADIVSGV